MKWWNLNFILLILLAFSCTSRSVTITLPSKSQIKGQATPMLILPDPPGKGMKEAEALFNRYANSDEFFAYAKNKIHHLDGGNESNVDIAIKKFRTCLNDMGPVHMEWEQYSKKKDKRVIGGWRKNFLAQNPSKDLDSIERAGHWLHEISHACGFSHIENDIMDYPIIKESWPYQIGNTFQEFLWKKVI